MQNEKTNPESVYRTLLTIWAALLMSQFMFVVIAFFSKPDLFKFDFTRPLLGEYAVEIGTIAAVAVVNLVISFTLRKRFTGQAIGTGSVALVQNAMIIACAFCEVISLFGLFVAFVFDYQYFFLFSILGIIGILLHFPKRGDVQAASFRDNLAVR